MLRSVALFLLLSGSAFGQSFSPELTAMFDAVTVDPSRIRLTQEQQIDVNRIVRLIKNGHEQKAMSRWSVFVRESATARENLDYEAISLSIVGRAFFAFEDVERIATRYMFYRDLRLGLQELSNDTIEYSRGADQNDLFFLDQVNSSLDQLKEDARTTNSDQESTMLLLQAATHQRADTLKRGKSMLEAQDEANQEIIGNLR